MADDMSIEQPRPIPRGDQVAQRWLKMRGIDGPRDSLPDAIDTKNPVQLVSDAYDLFVEKDELKADIVRKQRQAMESEQAPVLSLERKRELVRQGKINTLLSATNSTEPYGEVVGRSQVKIKEIDDQLDGVFSVPGIYDRFREDLSRQVRLRHEAREVKGLDRFVEQADLMAVKLTREAQVQGRALTSVERQVIEDNQTLKEETVQREQELLRDPDVFDRVRLFELQEYQRQLSRERFGLTPSRKAYLTRIEQYWAEGKKVLGTGETGTGKTELFKFASRLLFDTNPESVTGHQDMSIYELLGKTGFRIQEGDVFRPAPMVRAMTGRDGRGMPFLFDEIDRAPNQSVMGIKTILNARPGEKGLKIQTDSAGSFDVGSDYAVSATANIKSEKYSTATELDPAIVRVFDAPMDIDYMPAHEVYDLALASLIDRRGGIPLSEADAKSVLKNLCDAASWIQDAYQGRKIVTDTSNGSFIEARGQAATGKPATLKKALLDPGRALDMLKGWTAVQVNGISFEDYLSQRVVEFINNRAYPEEDRYYLAEIFALKGFLKGRRVNDLMVTGLTQDVLNRWSGSSERRESQKKGTAYLAPDRVAKLDPYRRFKRPVSAEAEDLLADEDEQQPGNETLSGERAREQEAWQEILGGQVDIAPLPDYVTDEVVRNLEAFGMELRFIPGLDLMPSSLRSKSVGEYLTELNGRYPNWKSYESLSDQEKADHSNIRNLREWFWEQVKANKINSPTLPGQWIAIETMEKPSYGNQYAQSPITARLGVPDRFNVTWNDATAAINKIKTDVLSTVGIPGSAEMRLPTALEWNLLGNREGWGKTNTYEWVQDEYREPAVSRRVIVGYSDYGGAAVAGGGHPDGSRDNVGFRVAVVLGS